MPVKDLAIDEYLEVHFILGEDFEAQKQEIVVRWEADSSLAGLMGLFVNTAKPV